MQNAGEWRRKQRVLQAEKLQISASNAEKDNELSGKLMQVKKVLHSLEPPPGFFQVLTFT